MYTGVLALIRATVYMVYLVLSWALWKKKSPVGISQAYYLSACGFESRPSNMPVIFLHKARESTEYTVPTHIGVKYLGKTKIYI